MLQWVRAPPHRRHLRSVCVSRQVWCSWSGCMTEAVSGPPVYYKLAGVSSPRCFIIHWGLLECKASQLVTLATKPRTWQPMIGNNGIKRHQVVISSKAGPLSLNRPTSTLWLYLSKAHFAKLFSGVCFCPQCNSKSTCPNSFSRVQESPVQVTQGSLVNLFLFFL
jgi:hypothetical protein